MPTNRNVIDFKIHNLTEEQFQELKAQGKIDPNALYCTPDETVVKFEELEEEVAKRVLIAQGIENAGKILKIDNEGNVTVGIQSSSFPILFHTWSDAKFNDTSWLCADTFSWHSGDVYVAAYEHLVDDVVAHTMYAWSSGSYIFYTLTDTPAIGDDVYFVNKNYGTSKVLSVSSNTITFEHHRTGETTTATRSPSNDTDTYAFGLNELIETIGGITITYTLADDGHKICAPDQESKLAELYEATGAAWYYILDIKNKQFKLPRTKWGFTGLRDSVGGYVEAGLPNITGQMKGGLRCYETNGAFKTLSNYNKAPNDYDYGSVEAVEFDASLSSSVYGNSNTVQPPATQMYLYFYVGNFEQSAVEQTAGLNAELFNSKADVNLNNTPFASLDNDGGILKWNGASVIAPAGMVAPYAGKTAPAGWLKCDGSAVSRTTYAALFAAIGTLYGAGDGSTTFNLPTQSVLPLGTSAPIYGNGINIIVQNQDGTKFDNIITKNVGQINSLATKANNWPNATNLTFPTKETFATLGIPNGNLYADLTQATGAQAIACIKY